ncbi:hypothetical protein [Steroidobacter cummioxidans]|uniref:hypothetical protein n=1 Tax=Steroidobacter cummioxidans TaxID=1803913 RepID=UPI000E3237B0|nr:hypothetical protein [Steroidobacter cummioxidans]
MIKVVFAVLMLWATTASADVDAHFSTGVLGARWGTTLDQVQVMYPGGASWPNGGERGGEIVYSVPGDFRVLALDIPVPLVHFIFSKENALTRAVLHFRYSDREEVLYGTALVLGQDYSIRDEASARVFQWKPGKASYVGIEIGSGPQFPWAFLGVRAIEQKAGVRR